MSIQTQTLPDRLQKRKAALAELDIQNCLQIAKELDDSTRFVLFLDAFYDICSAKTREHGGEVVKYMGDACLSIFDEEDCVAAIDCILAVRDAFPALCDRFDVRHTGVRGSVHTGEIIYGEFGPEGQKDVLGKTSNELFTIDRRGITISEQVYRKLPSDRRSAWKKTTGQVVYIMK
jgi:adenylate cyclase